MTVIPLRRVMQLFPQGEHCSRGLSAYKTNRRRRDVAFTLVELLTVIGIIAVLAAILFPVFATVRGKARQAGCQSNLRQVGLAVQMYTQDYDGLLPYAKDASDKAVPQIWSSTSAACQQKINAMPMLHPYPDTTVPGGFEPGVLDPYIKTKDIWRCPGDTGFDFLDNNDSCNGPCTMDARPSMYERYGGSYLFQTSLALAQTPVDSLHGTTEDGKPVGMADVNMLFDGNGSWHGNPWAFGRKGLRYVTLFLDGHAKLLTHDQYQDAWNKSRALRLGNDLCP